MKQWQQIAMRDSKLESPKEICGLVVNVKGKEVFFIVLIVPEMRIILF